MSEIICVEKMPVLALRGIVIYPEQTLHFDIGRVKSALALEQAMKTDQRIVLVPQTDLLNEDPDRIDLFPIGTVAKVKQILKSHGDNIRILVTGLYRVRIDELTQNVPYLEGSVTELDLIEEKKSVTGKVLCREAISLFF